MTLRKRFCQICEIILTKLLCKDDTDERYEVTRALDILKNDLDNDVSETAYDCEQRANVKYKETEADYQAKILREQKLQALEQEMEQKDIKEEQEEDQKSKRDEDEKYALYKLL